MLTLWSSNGLQFRLRERDVLQEMKASRTLLSHRKAAGYKNGMSLCDEGKQLSCQGLKSRMNSHRHSVGAEQVGQNMVPINLDGNNEVPFNKPLLISKFEIKPENNQYKIIHIIRFSLFKLII